VSSVEADPRLYNDNRSPAEIEPVFSSERMLHKNYYRKSSVGKKNILVMGLKVPDAKTN
jgi:hypothetical protein